MGLHIRFANTSIAGLGRLDSEGDVVEEGQSLLSEAWVTVRTQTIILLVANRRDITAFVSIGSCMASTVRLIGKDCCYS